MEKLLKLLVGIVLSVFYVGFSQAQHHRYQNNWGFSISGPGYGFSISSNNNHSSNFYYNQQPMMLIQPIPTIRQFQPMNLIMCNNNIYMDMDQFGNQASPQYKICWNIDQFGNQISPLFRQ